MADTISQEQAKRYQESWLLTAEKSERLDDVINWISDKLSEQCDYQLDEELKERWRAAHTG